MALNNSKPFSTLNFNPHILNVEYAVRGLIPTRASEIALELDVDHKWPFNELTYLNLGNPQNLGSKPITFGRQLISLCAYPPIIDLPGACSLFPEDVLIRAKSIISSITSFGGYTDSFGFEFVRREVANYISYRDNCQADFRNIFLSDGASKIIFNIISCIAKVQDDIPSGILIPIPQYPLYTACLSYFGIVPIPYFLDEDNDWGLSMDELQEALVLNQGKSIPRAMVVINPGNPTGQCLPFHMQVEILKFCNEQRLLLLADEVYQDNLHDDAVKWFSFKNVYSSIQVLIYVKYLPTLFLM
ncbi:tyrosine aminotransferase [Oopsacas minuta]|uniref:alanine transaminase n=1 Tax=Oopsacas minuta TaxID=111878 RepID=A0AAV7JSC1_9METZ|nr:tyrosine aminotransferase [Oopsacas minuta]